jgi:hypothetical protein
VDKRDYEDLPPCLITIDKEGRWYHKGAEIIRRDIVKLFYENMVLDPRGRPVIHWQGQRCFVEAEDTAHVVWRVDAQAGPAGGLDRILLTLSDETVEPLVPQTLVVGRENVLYCDVKSGRFQARFSRAAYYQIAEWIEEEAGRFYLILNGKTYPLEPKAGGYR